MPLASVSAEVDVVNMALQRLGQPTIATMTESSRDANIANQIYAQNRDYCLMLFDWDCLRTRQTMTRSGKTAVESATAANPVVVTATGHVYVANELVTVESVTGMTQLNDNIYRVYSVTASSVTLYNTDGTSLNGTSFTAYSTGGFLYRYAGSDFAYVYDVPSNCLVVREVLDEVFGMSNSYTWVKEKTYLYTDVESAGVLYTKQETDPSLYEPDLVEVIVSRLAWFIAMRVHSMKDLRADMRGEYQAALARAKLTNATGQSDEGEPEDLWAEVR